MNKFGYCAALLYLITGCGGNGGSEPQNPVDTAEYEVRVDLESMSEYPEHFQFSKNDFNLSLPVDYWDVRIPWFNTGSTSTPTPTSLSVSNNYLLLKSFDNASFSNLDESLKADLSGTNTLSDTGIVYQCSPRSCPVYIAGVGGSGIFLITDYDSLIEFVGNVDTSAEAWLVLWANDLNPISYKKVDSGYEVYAKTTDGDWYCFQDQYLMVYETGKVELLKEMSKFYLHAHGCSEDIPECICR